MSMIRAEYSNGAFCRPFRSRQKQPTIQSVSRCFLPILPPLTEAPSVIKNTRFLAFWNGIFRFFAADNVKPDAPYDHSRRLPPNPAFFGPDSPANGLDKRLNLMPSCCESRS